MRNGGCTTPAGLPNSSGGRKTNPNRACIWQREEKQGVNWRDRGIAIPSSRYYNSVYFTDPFSSECDKPYVQRTCTRGDIQWLDQ